MKIHKILAIAALFASITFVSPANAHDNGLITKPSPYGVGETLDRLEAIFAKKGITVFARVDHAAGAKKVGADMKPTQLLIFGNPKMGTPLIMKNRVMGIDLPLKVLAWEDNNGKTMIAYNDPEFLAKRHGVTGHPVLAKMAGALKNLTGAATKK
ncbi:MAG: DUF302 domain-containing protein [Rhodospirillales bacterium]|nr:DUF302 domain-containing protein [Rhodospirillales bacterium]